MLALSLSLLVSGCTPPPKQFVGVGDVVEIDTQRRHVTIRHDAIVGFAGAATTGFEAEDAALMADTAVGQRVRFVLRQQGAAFLVTTITRLEEGNPGVHDHTPHHGGVVAMVGMTHVEARAETDGRIRVYLTDRFRRPLPLSDVRGSVTLSLPDGKRNLPFALVGESLEATGPPLTGREVNAAVQLVHAGQSLDMTFQLPLAAGRGGAAGIPAEGCVAPANRSAGGPRCTLTFRRPIGVLAATPDGTRLIVAAADIGVSAWQVQSTQLLIGFEPAPAVVLSAPEAPHVEVANAVAVRPDGKRAVVALENRLLIYEVESGRLVSARPHPTGIVRSVAWSPSGDALLVAAFYDPAARLIAAEDGREERSFAVDREGAAVAFADDGRKVAVGSELGPIALFDSTTGTRLRTLTEARTATRALAFVGSALVAVSDDGALRSWDLDTEAPAIELAIAVASPLAREPNGVRVAGAGRDGVVRVYAVTSRTTVAELRWHVAPLSALAWAGTTIVSGDSEGHIAFWDAP